MLRFEFLNARHGDCFLVRWGDARVMLVDGGPHGTYEDTLKPHLMALTPGSGGQRVLDVVCVTHVDDDHVVGVLRLLTELHRAVRDLHPAPFRVKNFWFNSVEELVESQDPGLVNEVQQLGMESAGLRTVAASINQGREIRNRAAGLGLGGNAPFAGPLRTGATAEVEGLEIVVVAPDQTALNKLTKKWRKAKKKADPSVIASAYADRAVPNLSSTVLLIKHQQRTALLTGDARGDRILAGLREVGLLPDNAPLHVDLLKLPHHGSINNVTGDFFHRVHADHYVISSDGIAHHHPHEDTLRWLVESRNPQDHFEVHLTNHIPYAMHALDELREGRAFEVAARSAPQPALEIEINA